MLQGEIGWRNTSRDFSAWRGYIYISKCCNVYRRYCVSRVFLLSLSLALLRDAVQVDSRNK